MSSFFQWDSFKNFKNGTKHGVDFDEAATVVFDPRHSEDEDRYFAIGKSLASRILFVSFSFRRSQSGKEVYYRIISARPASKKERKSYEAQSERLGD